MRKFLSLLKLQLNSHYGISYALYNFKNDKKTMLKGLGIAIAVVLALTEVIGLYTYLMVQVFKTASSMYVPELVLTLAVVLSGLIVLVFGIFYILSTLFLAKDTELLASLPIPQGSVFVSKFVLVLLGEYPIVYALMLPPVIIYGVGMQRGVLYYIVAIFCTLFIPLIPLIISATLSMLLMNVVSRSRRRDLITIIGSIILMVLIIGGQNYIMSRLPENGQDIMLEILKNSRILVDVMGRAFPPAVWITNILSLDGIDALINLVYLLVISAIAFLVVYLLASFIYQRGALAQLETQAKPGKTKLSYGSSSHLMAIFKTELRGIVRTPIYALNSLVMIFVAPLMMMLPMFGGNFASDPDIKFLFDLIQNGESQSELLLIVAGIITLMALINPAASSTFSREGKCFWILKNIPVRPEVQVYGKLLAGYSISFVAAVLTSIVTMLSFKLSPGLTFMIIVLSGIALVPICIWNIFIDLKKPKLTWNSPTEAIKQNFNVVVGMLVGFVILAVFGVAGYFINKIDLNVYAVFGIMSAIILIAAAISFSFLKKTAQTAYQKIEA